MATRLRIRFDEELYDVGEIEDTIEEFKDVARVTLHHHESGAEVTIEAGEEEATAIAGALANIALARTIEVRS